MKSGRHGSGRGAGRWIVAGAVSTLAALVPISAGAAGLDNEPRPTNWPTVDRPTESTGQSDPRPASRPTVARPETGQGRDPRPLSWPAPDKQ